MTPKPSLLSSLAHAPPHTPGVRRPLALVGPDRARRRSFHYLTLPAASPSPSGVVLRAGRVDLLRNERDEWELPGDKLEVGESLAGTSEPTPGHFRYNGSSSRGPNCLALPSGPSATCRSRTHIGMACTPIPRQAHNHRRIRRPQGACMTRSTVLVAAAALLLAGCGSSSAEAPTPVEGPELAVAEANEITVYKSPT